MPVASNSVTPLRAAPAFTLGLFLLASLMLGAAGLSPRLWAGTWLGWALMATAMASARSIRTAVLGSALGLLLLHVVWFNWSAAMARSMLPPGSDPKLVLGIAAGFILVVALPSITMVCAGLLFLGRRRLLRFWLPLAWAFAEYLLVAWSNIDNGLLFTQVDVAPVMRALGRLGLWPTTTLCLFAAISVGEGLALRRYRLLWPAAVITLGLMLLPPLSQGDLSLLEGVGVVHLRTRFEIPPVDQADDDLALLVWPETSIAQRPRLREGPAAGAHLDGPLGGPLTAHLVGALTLVGHHEQNSALAVAPDGTILAARAKSRLMPGFERRFLGFGPTSLLLGHAMPLLDVGGRKVIPLICGEILNRPPIATGRAAGGQLLTVLAHDTYQAGLDLTDQQVLAIVRLRAIEFGIPAVYSSLVGRASIIAADGTVLARSEHGAPSGVLTLNRRHGAEDRQPVAAPAATVLYSRLTPQLRPDCPPGRCVFVALEDDPCRAARGASGNDTVIVTGHASPPRYLGQSGAALARAVACLSPKLVIIDTCLGASLPLLSELAQRLPGVLVVASTQLLAERGFRYGAALFGAKPEDERARAVTTVPPTPLFIGRLDPAAFARVEAEVAAASGDMLRPRVRSWSPTLVSADVGDGQEFLVPADWRLIGHPPLAHSLRRQ